MVGMHVHECGGAAGGCHHVAELPALLQAGRHQLRLDVDHARHRLVAVVGAGNQQHVVSGIAQPVHRLDHARRIGIGLAQHGQMLRRPQRAGVLRGIRFAHPQDRQRRRALEEHFVDEARGHGALACCILGDIQGLHPLDPLAAWARMIRRGDRRGHGRRGRVRRPPPARRWRTGSCRRAGPPARRASARRATGQSPDACAAGSRDGPHRGRRAGPPPAGPACCPAARGAQACSRSRTRPTRRAWPRGTWSGGPRSCASGAQIAPGTACGPRRSDPAACRPGQPPPLVACLASRTVGHLDRAPCPSTRGRGNPRPTT